MSQSSVTENSNKVYLIRVCYCLYKQYTRTLAEAFSNANATTFPDVRQANAPLGRMWAPGVLPIPQVRRRS